MSAPAEESSRLKITATRAGHRGGSEPPLRVLASTPVGISDAESAKAAQCPRPVSDPIPCRGSPPAIAFVVESRTEAQGSRARRLDPESQTWVEALHSVGSRRDDAIRRLHALLLREARFEVRRRTAPLAHPSGGDLDDLAVQAADDAVVAVLAKLDRFRGDSLFTTWARRFAQREAPAKIRRRLGRGRDLPMEFESERARMWPLRDETPHERCVARESARTLARLIADELTPHQREVLIALAIQGMETEDVARRLDTTSGALYKTLHDARRKLRAGLVAAGHPAGEVAHVIVSA